MFLNSSGGAPRHLLYEQRRSSQLGTLPLFIEGVPRRGEGVNLLSQLSRKFLLWGSCGGWVWRVAALLVRLLLRLALVQRLFESTDYAVHLVDELLGEGHRVLLSLLARIKS